MGFLVYAARGLVDQLKEQLETIFRVQFADRWEQFVYQTFAGATSPSEHRRIRVALELSRRSSATGEPVLTKEIPQLSPELAGAFATKTGKTLTRDINALKEMQLIEARGRGLVPLTSKIQGLWPEIEGGVLFEA